MTGGTKEAIEYFGGDELAASVWTEKYALRDRNDNLLETSPDQMHRRIAREFARVEAKKFAKPYSEDFIYEYLKDFGSLIPQGSPMAGIGSSQYVSTSNCFVVQPPTDSYGGVMMTDEQMVQICKRRGGVGTDISAIRPDSMPTTNSARWATGLIPFMERFSNSIREVGQAGRRGALMLTVSVHHPQVLDFARVKLDPSKVTGANISIRLTDEFLNAVRDGTQYEQRWPVTGTPEVRQMVDAREVWREIIRCAHSRAEPGLLFWDRILTESPADCYADVGFGTVSTNPCITARTLLLTPNGLRKLGDLDAGDTIWSEDGWVTIKRKWSTGVKDVYRYRTTAGVVYATENHRIVQEGVKVELQHAESIDVLRGPDFVAADYLPDTNQYGVQHDPQAVMDGLYFGDGAGTYTNNEVLYIGEDDQCYFDSEIKNLIVKKGHKDSTWYVKSTLTANDLGLTYNRRIPQKYMEARSEQVASFLRGLYSANGSVVRNRITFKTASAGLVEDIQMLLSSLGIASYFTTNQPHNVEFRNGVYECKESYDINITRDRAKFAEVIGFLHPYKNEKLAKAIAETGPSYRTNIHRIISVDLDSTEEVFDIEVEGAHHTYWCGGHNVSNCSELGLSILDSCRLLLANLFSCVLNPFSEEQDPSDAGSSFDFDDLYHKAYVAQRLMDDLVDLEIECVERIIKKVQSDPEPEEVKARELALWQKVRTNAINGRRTGTGITALGDAMAAVGIRYGSDESVEFTERVYRTLKLGAYRSSVDMAKEIGPFPVWDAEKEKNCPFLLRLKEDDPKLYRDMQKYGRRNIALLTTAPAGSVSLLAGPRPHFGTTSGIEPLFQDKPYKRRKKVNHSVEGARVDFTDAQGDKWTEYEVFHPKIKMWMEVTGETDWKNSPYHSACAEDLDWTQRVKLQAVAQRHIDHSISSTINLPEDVTVEKVAEIYETAWQAGCKGITVYRKNCRTGVLIDKDQPEQKAKTAITKTTAPKRPTEVPCDLHRTTVKGEPCIVFVGLYAGEPYEVFALVGKTDIQSDCDTGVLLKEKRGHYRFLCPESSVDLTECLTDDQAAVTRLTSTSLRHGADTAFVVHQLEKVKGPINGFAKAVARVLKKYIRDGTKVTGERCGKCESPNLIRQEGCVRCGDCGWAKCT